MSMGPLYVLFGEVSIQVLCSFFMYVCIYLFLDRGEGREKEGEKHQCVVASRVSPTEDLARNPGTYPGWELNWRPFGLQAGTQFTELHQPAFAHFFNWTVSPIICICSISIRSSKNFPINFQLSVKNEKTGPKWSHLY